MKNVIIIILKSFALIVFSSVLVLNNRSGLFAQEAGRKPDILIKWETAADMPEARRNLKAVSLNNRIYAAGGYAQPHKGKEKGLFVYDVSKDVWTVKKDMITGRSNFSFAEYGGFLYAIGGDPFLDKTEKYDPDKNEWKSLSPMPTARQHVYGCLLNKKIYVTGGLLSWTQNAEADLSDKHEVFDIQSGKWKVLKPLPEKMQNPCLASFDNKVYVFGGMYMEDFSPSIYIFDIKSGKWSRSKDMPVKGFFSGAAAIGDKIFVLDGVKENEDFTRVMVYDPNKDSWGFATRLPVGIQLAGFTSIGNTLYMTGGCGGDFKAVKTVYIGKIQNP